MIGRPRSDQDLTQSLLIALSKEMRDDILKSARFVHQETFFLWEAFVRLAGPDSGNFSVSVFAQLVSKQTMADKEVGSWVLAALDSTGIGRLHFKDWVQAINVVCRGTAADLSEVASRVLGLGSQEEEEMIRRAEKLGAEPGEGLEKAVRKLKLRGAHAELGNMALESVGDWLVELLAPHLEDMESKLKRVPTLSLRVLCRRELLPEPVRVICNRLESIEKISPKCVSFSPDSLYRHRSLVEAVTNAYLHGWTPTECLSPDVLLMVLRTYLRLLTEPLFTLHVARPMLAELENECDETRITALIDAIQSLPRANRHTIICIVKCAHFLNHDSHSLDTLARILSYSLIRSEPKSSATSPPAIALTKLLISEFAQIKPMLVDIDDSN